MAIFCVKAIMGAHERNGIKPGALSIIAWFFATYLAVMLTFAGAYVLKH